MVRTVQRRILGSNAKHLYVRPVCPAPTFQVLGRADQLQSFVSHGVDEDASVTVELFIPDGPPLKIERRFNRHSNRSNYLINGR